jgi:hypothetical protein
VRVTVGQMTAAAAYRDLISAVICSASLAEFSAGYSLLMHGVSRWRLTGDRRHDGIAFYWTKSQYMLTSLLVLGHGDDYVTVERFLLQAETASVIQSAQAMVAAMAVRLESEFAIQYESDSESRVLPIRGLSVL